MAHRSLRLRVAITFNFLTHFSSHFNAQKHIILHTNNLQAVNVFDMKEALVDNKTSIFGILT